MSERDARGPEEYEHLFLISDASFMSSCFSPWNDRHGERRRHGRMRRSLDKERIIFLPGEAGEVAR